MGQYQQSWRSLLLFLTYTLTSHDSCFSKHLLFTHTTPEEATAVVDGEI
jgi:hypothetical protein